ncbi:MAG: hypothetical protein ACUVXJ_11825 [Phycisphaerae bacterium]
MRSAAEAVTDADMHLILEAWETLPDAVRAGILAMVKAAKGAR